MDISIGKFTLESLTTGMYNEPETCFREYIQNAVDSIDIAIEQGVLSIDESRIEILVDDDQGIISIRDNGTGISQATVGATLLDIGNSTKLHTVNRGFRGIGRLGGLSYCKSLSFCTTAKGDNTKTIVTFDCDQLRKLLVPGQGDEHTLQSVIEAVTTIETLEEQASSHFFIVKMEGVDDIASLLDLDLVKDYISQVAPVPFRKGFYWESAIKSELNTKGVCINEYPIFIGRSFESLTQIYKSHIDLSEKYSDLGGDTYLYYWNVPSTKADYFKSACHAVELAYVLNNPQDDIYSGKVDEATAAIAQEAWTNFAKTGNPSVESVEWSKFDSTDRNTMVIELDGWHVDSDPLKRIREIMNELDTEFE